MSSQRLNIAFAGTPELAATVLESLVQHNPHNVKCVYTQPDRPAGRGQKIHKSPVKELAEKLQLPVRQPANSTELAAERLLEQVDVLIVAAYGMILPESVLTKPRFGCINIHTSLLPRWRGAAPIQRAIQAGDIETGITIIQMDAGLDTGDILYQQRCPIKSDDTSRTLHERLSFIGSECTHITLDMLTEGELKPVTQSETGVTYARKIQKSDALINWSDTAVKIDCQIRAFNPSPIAYTTLNNYVMRIWQAQILDSPVTQSPSGTIMPGKILRYSAEGIDVSTSDQMIRILKLQLPGKKPVGVRDFFNGNPGFWKN